MPRQLIHFLSAPCFLLGCVVIARAQFHPAEPAVNLGDTSFLDAVGGPGLLIEEIGDESHSGTADSVSGLTHIALLTKLRILNAWYGVEVIGAAARVDAGVHGTASGWGDVTVSPLILQWAERKFGGIRVQQRVVFDFDLPAGEYRRDANVSLSSHAFTVHPYYAITAYLAKRVETSWRVHYLWNSRNDAPPTSSGFRSTQAGQAVHFNATLGYALPHGIWIGANGYVLKQVTAPQIDGRQVANSPEQVGAIGPGAVWNLGPVLLFANFYHELGAENRTEGNKLVLRVQWIVSK